MQVTMEALLAELLAVMGDFHCHPRVVRIFRRSCRITPQSNSPMPVLPTMQSDDVRQENMATVNIPLKYCWKSFKRKQFIHSTIAELQVSMAVYFLYRNSTNDDLWYIPVFWIDLATSSTVTAHEWSSFTMSINTCLSHHLNWRQQKLLKIRLQKMRSSMYRFTGLSTSTSV